jgi:ABC-2 type transport system permease protein
MAVELPERRSGARDRWADVRRRLDARFPRRAAATDEEPRLVPGWRVIAAKELTDHVTSVRFIVLLVILALAAAVPLYFASGQIRAAAEQASGQPSVFLALFYLGSPDYSFLRADQFVALLAPLLGIAFGFDAINVERNEGTLPRLVSQPIHRDDVINGKFIAGLAVIALTLLAMVLIVSGFGMLRLGIVPTLGEIVRLILWLALTVLYVGLWLAFGMLLSVLLRRAASAALIGFGVWLAIVIFGSLVTTLIGNLVAPVPSDVSTVADAQHAIDARQAQQFITRLSPHTLYLEAESTILVPVDPVTAQGGAANYNARSIDELIQAADQRRIANLNMPIDQSLLLVWPHVVALVALTTLCFAAAYVAFMRQEVRA